jgi:O-antigen/teichoic acid export membrane protein
MRRSGRSVAQGLTYYWMHDARGYTSPLDGTPPVTSIPRVRRTRRQPSTDSDRVVVAGDGPSLSDAAPGLSRSPAAPDVDDEGVKTTGTAIVVNAASLMFSRLAVAAMGWFGTVLIVRHLSVGDWGRFSFVFGLLGMMGIVTNMANPRIVFRELAKDDGQVVGTYVLLRLALGLLAYAVSIAFVVIGHYPDVVLRATAIAGTLVVIANAASGYNVLFEYRMRLSSIAMAAILGQAVQLALTVLLAVLHSSLVVFTIPAVIAEVVGIAWKLYRLPRTPRLHYTIDWRRWSELLKLSVPLAIGGALSTMYYNLDTIMLSKMQTFRAVGEYNIAYKFAAIAAFVSASMSPALFPIFVRYWPGKADRFKAVLKKTMCLYLTLGALVALEFGIFADRAITLLYGSHYAVGANAARLVVGSECVGFFVDLAVVTLVSMNRNITYPFVALGGLLLNLALNLWAIPRWSYFGAAWVTLITEVIVLVVIWVPTARYTGTGLLDRRALGKIAVSCGIAAEVMVGLLAIGPWPVAAGVGAVTYVVALALLKVGGPGTPLSSIRALVTLDS